MNILNSNLERKLSNPPIEIMVVNDKYIDVYDTETKLQALLELHLTKYHIVVSYFENRQTSNNGSNNSSNLCRVPKYLEMFLKKQSNCISLLQSNYNVQTKVTKYYNLTGIKVK